MRVGLFFLLLLPPLLSARSQAAPAQNVIVVMTDGLRWQEVFRGAEEGLLTPTNYYKDRPVDTLKKRFFAATPEGRRALLMPFLWNTFIAQGVIYGDLDAGSDAHVTNGFNFSYPGYNETLTGHADPRIDSNKNIPNPNVTVLEWINRQPGFLGRVAAFGAWENFTGILNAPRCKCNVNVSYDPLMIEPRDAQIELLNELKAGAPRYWDDEAFDAPVFATAMRYLEMKKPRVLFVSLGETDDWAHGGNYGEYLDAAHRVDGDLARLWSTLQAMPEYRAKTTVLFLTDHGRGGSENDGWKCHGQKLPESQNIFIGMLGAGIGAVGIEHQAEPVTQNQVAATVARLLGLDWNAAEPLAGRSLLQ